MLQKVKFMTNQKAAADAQADFLQKIIRMI